MIPTLSEVLPIQHFKCGNMQRVTNGHKIPQTRNHKGRIADHPLRMRLAGFESARDRIKTRVSIQTRDEWLCGLSVFFIFAAECSHQSRFFDANAVEHRECWWHEGR
jgi:hypothetical protein